MCVCVGVGVGVGEWVCLTYVIESTYSVQNPCCYHIELESFSQY